MYNKIVVSLTTIESRIELVKKVITNLFDQTLKPNVIHIFYSNEPLFYDSGIDNLTMSNLIKELDLINFYNIEIIASVTKNIGPYRKLIPALKIYKNDIIITIDDDHQFESEFIHKYVDQYVNNKCIVCSGGKFFDIQNYNNIVDHTKAFNTYFAVNPIIQVMNYIPEGFGGILYHSNMFDSDFIDFDYDSLPELIKKNDDVFIRNYTFKKNIKVVLLYIKKNHILDIHNQESLYYSYNINTKISNVFHEINKLNLNFANQRENVINMDDEILYFQIKNNMHDAHQDSRANIKLLQYEEYTQNKTAETIDLKALIEKYLIKKNIFSNCLMINIEKDKDRLLSGENEIKKLKLDTFVQFKATYWKETKKFIDDLNFVLAFLKKFNNKIEVDDFNKITMNKFSEISDKNIFIQDGPLACYCSHVRAMIYGYFEFHDYTIICEDDLFIAGTNLIEKYIKCIPNDWDIICFNSKPISNEIFTKPYYKFNSTFCSLHFYIIKNKCLPTIFRNIYPITDQIDILVGNLYDQLNIYNIVDTVYQKNFSTNTQNNLNVILNTPGYESIRETINIIKEQLLLCIDLSLPNNTQEINKNLMLHIVFDVLYNYIVNNNEYRVDNNDVSKIIDEQMFDAMDITNVPTTDDIYFVKLYELIYFLIKCCVKGINTRNVVFALINDIKYIIECFTLHNTVDEKTGMIIKAHGYGSSANVYLSGDIIIKAFNKKLRWNHPEHDNYLKLFKKEMILLKKLYADEYINYIEIDEDNLLIKMKYFGVSLYDFFTLPDDWREQLKNIFFVFDKSKINYVEFNLKNIMVHNGIIKLIDFGLASISENDNAHNYEIFVELLELLENQFSGITDIQKKQVMYKIFINNIKNEQNSKYKNNIF